MALTVSVILELGLEQEHQDVVGLETEARPTQDLSQLQMMIQIQLHNH